MDELSKDRLRLFFDYYAPLPQSHKPYLIFLDLKTYYVKWCVGLPTDTIEIDNGDVEFKTLENKITELTKQLSKYEDLIQKLEIELESSASNEDMEEVNIENSILKSELRQIEQKNRSFENELNELKKIIKNKDKEIEDLIYLKDSQHHG